MAKKQFIYNNKLTKVDSEAGTIEVQDLELAGIFNVFSCTLFEIDTLNKQILVKPRFWKTDINGKVFGKKTSPELEERKYTNKNKTRTGVGYFDFFYNLIRQNKNFGEVLQSALMNDQLENMLEYYGKPIGCWNAYADWVFFTPIEASIVSLTKTEEAPETGTIAVEIKTNSNFSIEIINAGNSQITYPKTPYAKSEQGVQVISDLALGDYVLNIYSNSDTGFEQIKFSI